MKVVINKCFGGFGLSHDAVMAYAKKKGFELYPFVDKRDVFDGLDLSSAGRFKPYVDGERVFIIHYSTKPLKDGMYEKDSYFAEREIERGDPELVKTVEELGDLANGLCAKLVVVEIPDNIEWEIDEYDGMETIHEKHRVWG